MSCAACFQRNVYPGKNSFLQTVTVNTSPLIIRTCSEDCSRDAKLCFCPSLKRLFNLVVEFELICLPASKDPTKREKNLGFDHTAMPEIVSGTV